MEPWILQIDGTPLELPLDAGGPLSARLVSISGDIVKELQDRDLNVIEPTEAIGAAEAIDQATCVIGVAPYLASIVRRCVQDILVLRSSDDTIDVSHSEPCWPTRIFVSIPTSSPIRDLRIAEAIVHEAMHLNLTFLEGCAQFVREEGLMYSPWRTEARPASGVLHGLYVFSCIYRFLGYVARENPLDDRRQGHITQRLADIRDQIDSIDRRSLLQCFTPTGAVLAQSLFSAVEIARVRA
jgi:HEXXH motif-containing protein